MQRIARSSVSALQKAVNETASFHEFPQGFWGAHWDCLCFVEPPRLHSEKMIVVCARLSIRVQGLHQMGVVYLVSER
jgi:hypothetical protein